MKYLESQDRGHPVLSRETAEEAIRLHGYVRMDGHTATDLAQLDQLYQILEAKAKGAYTPAISIGEALSKMPVAPAPITPGAPIPFAAVVTPPAPVAPAAEPVANAAEAPSAKAEPVQAETAKTK